MGKLSRFGRGLMGLGAAGAAGYCYCAYVYPKRFQNSMTFTGESWGFDSSLDRKLGFPYSKLVPLVCAIKFNPFEDPEPTLKEMHEICPDSMLTEATRWFVAAFNGREEEAGHALAAAREKLAEHPEINGWLKEVLPTDKEANDLKGWDLGQRRRKVADAVWGITGVACGKDGSQWGYPIQAAVVKVGGDAAIINPIPFTEEDRKYIEENIGSVKWILSPSTAHGQGAAKASAMWPEAELWGVDPLMKHEQPSLKWKWLWEQKPNEDGTVDFAGGKLRAREMEGNAAREAILYHQDTSTLIGPCDTSLPVNHALYLHAVGAGMVTSEKPPPMASQIYHHGFTTDHASLARSVDKVMEWDFDKMVLGHGGVIGDGDTDGVKTAFKDSFKWVQRDMGPVGSAPLMFSYMASTKPGGKLFQLIAQALYGKPKEQ